MEWFGLGRATTHERVRDERALERLADQEQRVQALDRVVEVIQRQLPDDGPHAAE